MQARQLFQKKEKFLRSLKNFWPFIVFAILFLSFFAFDLHSYLTFDALKKYHTIMTDFVSQHFIWASLLYCFAYFLTASLSVPGAGLVTMVGGFLFGRYLGTLYVIISATLGACVLFLMAQTALRPFLKDKAGPWLSKMRAGFKENAFYYLLSLRLIPVFPFFVVNLVPAFLGVDLKTFFTATVIGIIPACFIYVSIGTDLGKLLATNEAFSLKAFLSPSLLFSLTALGLLALVPIIVKKYRKRGALLKNR